MAKKPNKKSRAGSSTITVDFSGVEVKKSVPEGEYIIKPVEITKETGNEHDYLKWVFQIDEGKYKGSNLYINTSLSPQSLWNLKGVLLAIGIEVPDSTFDLDLQSIIEDAQPAIGLVEQEIYEGKKRSRLVEVYAADEADLEESEEEDDEEEEAEDDLTAEDILKMDEEELEGVIEEYDLDVDLDDHKKLKAKQKAVAEAFSELSEDEESEEEDDEEEEAEKLTKEEVFEMKSKELDALIEEHELEVDEDLTGKAKKRAVYKALQEEGLAD